VCTRAQVHLQRMGVLEDILAAKQGRWASVGGFVSPSGIRVIGTSAQHMPTPVVIAIKRLVLDEKIARAAVRAGATLVEEAPVARAVFAAAQGIWTIHCRPKHPQEYQARVLVAADGASSALARSLGVVTTFPEAVCSRAYVTAGTSSFDMDGLVFYPPTLLPGYCALLREAGDEINFCCYIMPGGQCTPTDLRTMHNTLLHTDTHVRQALGPEVRLERMKGAALRLGGVPCSYADHLLVVGDAAGHIDPLTGEGIQYGMDAAAIAAETLAEAFAAHDWRASMLKCYQERWMRAFGWDFVWSQRMAVWYTRHPIFLDACAVVTQRRGTEFLDEWAQVMTGTRPKSAFLRSSLMFPLLGEVVRQWWRR